MILLLLLISYQIPNFCSSFGHSHALLHPREHGSTNEARISYGIICMNSILALLPIDFCKFCPNTVGIGVTVDAGRFLTSQRITSWITGRLRVDMLYSQIILAHFSDKLSYLRSKSRNPCQHVSGILYHNPDHWNGVAPPTLALGWTVVTFIIPAGLCSHLFTKYGVQWASWPFFLRMTQKDSPLATCLDAAQWYVPPLPNV